MKFINMRKINILLFFIFAVLFNSCGGNFSDNEEAVESLENAITLSGKVILLPARSASLSFSEDLDYSVTATLLDTQKKPVADSVINGDFDESKMTWNVTIEKAGFYKIEINAAQASSVVLSGSVEADLSNFEFSKVYTLDDIILSPTVIENVKGSIALDIFDESNKASTVTCNLSAADVNKSEAFNFTAGKARVSFSDLKSQSYELSFTFKDSAGQTIYFCKDKVPVFSGFTTDTWYGENTYLKKASDSETVRFVLTEDLINSYIKTDFVEYPVIIWDRDTKLSKMEFENPQPGFAVFSDVNNGDSVLDGFALAQKKIIIDFAIDPKTQKIYTIEQPAISFNNSYPLADWNNSYPKTIYEYGSNYTGYAAATVAAEFSSDNTYAEIEDISVYDGSIFALTSSSVPLVRFKNGVKTECALKDTDGTSSLSLNNINKIEVFENNLYLLNYNNDVNNYVVYKFQIGEIEDDKLILTCVGNYLYKSASELGFVNTNLEVTNAPSVGIADMILSNDGKKLYLLYSNTDSVYDSQNDIYHKCDRGGIVTIDTEAWNYVSLDGSGELIFGWYATGYRPSEEDEQSYLFAPTKFIARKPDELVIADEACYFIEDKKAFYRNRVVKINLMNFAMQAVDVNAGFDYYLGSSETTCEYTSSSY